MYVYMYVCNFMYVCMYVCMYSIVMFTCYNSKVIVTSVLMSDEAYARIYIYIGLVSCGLVNIRSC